jgi:hypothetical protein
VKEALQPYIRLIPYAAVGLVLVILAVLGILYVQRGGRLELEGSIQKVRTIALDQNSSAAIIDFRVRNPSDYLYIVQQIAVMLVDGNGNEIEGTMVSDVDARKLFEYFPALGQKYNESLTYRTRIAPGESIDRMLAVRFEIPEAQLQKRKNLRVLVRELDSPVESEILERQS